MQQQKQSLLPSPGALAVILAAILWSLDGLLRRNLYTVSPSIVVFWEHLLGLIVLLPFVMISWKKFKLFSKKQIISIAFVALLSGALGTIFYTAAQGQ